jgi:hypothetical protein
MEYTIFISHSNKDEKAVEAIRNHLEQCGYTCFVSDRDLKHNANWQPLLVEAMDSSKILLYIHTKNSNLSSEVGREINYFADRCRRPILVYRLSAEPYNNDRVYYVQSINYIDSISNPSEGLNSLTDTIKETIAGLHTSHHTQNYSTKSSWPRIALFSVVLFGFLLFGLGYHEFERKEIGRSLDLCTYYLSLAEGYIAREDSLDYVFPCIWQAEEVASNCPGLTIRKPEFPDFQFERERCSTSLAGIRSKRIDIVNALYEPLRYAHNSNKSASVNAIKANIRVIHTIDSLLGSSPDEKISIIETNLLKY